MMRTINDHDLAQQLVEAAMETEGAVAEESAAAMVGNSVTPFSWLEHQFGWGRYYGAANGYPLLPYGFDDGFWRAAEMGAFAGGETGFSYLAPPFNESAEPLAPHTNGWGAQQDFATTYSRGRQGAAVGSARLVGTGSLGEAAQTTNASATNPQPREGRELSKSGNNAHLEQEGGYANWYQHPFPADGGGVSPYQAMRTSANMPQWYNPYYARNGISLFSPNQHHSMWTVAELVAEQSASLEGGGENLQGWVNNSARQMPRLGSGLDFMGEWAKQRRQSEALAHNHEYTPMHALAVFGEGDQLGENAGEYTAKRQSEANRLNTATGEIEYFRNGIRVETVDGLPPIALPARRGLGGQNGSQFGIRRSNAPWAGFTGATDQAGALYSANSAARTAGFGAEETGLPSVVPTGMTSSIAGDNTTTTQSLLDTLGEQVQSVFLKRPAKNLRIF